MRLPISSIVYGAAALAHAATAASLETRAGPSRPCEMWIPQFGVNTVFIKGQQATITWDVSKLPSIVCPLTTVKLIGRYSDYNHTVGPFSDPRSGSFTFAVPSPEPSIAEYLMTFDMAVDGVVTWPYPVLISFRGERVLDVVNSIFT